MEITVGADPEVFLQDLMGEVRSAIGHIGGTKNNPRKTKNGTVQEDNVAAEFNISPASSAQVFADNIAGGLDDINELIANRGLMLSEKASAIFDMMELRDKKAHIAGCDPDFDVWSKTTNTPPKISGTNFRCVGGHVHVGFKARDDSAIANFIKCLDLFLAVPAVLVEDKERKKLYGKAGAFRLTSYGIEYRTLSNFWIFSEAKCKWVFDQVIAAILAHDSLIVPLTVQEAINSHDADMVKKLTETYSLTPVPA